MNLDDALKDADMICVVARQGDDVRLVTVAARIGRERNVQVTAIYLVPGNIAEDANLKTLREAVHMLVIASDESYVAAMISALGS